MKTKYLLLFLILFANILLASEHKQLVISFDSLPYSLSRGIKWKFNENDQVDFKSKIWNDQQWKSVFSTLNMEDSSTIKLNGISWFRLNFFVDTTLVDLPLALKINHYGASEIYVDGKLIHKFGRILHQDKIEYFG
jgi:hypothetical protein